MSDEKREQLNGIELISSDRPTVTSGQAASILGFSRWTLLRRLKQGRYSGIGRCETRGGWLFDMEDTIRTAFPTADDAQVAMLMGHYREKFRRKRGGDESHEALQEKIGCATTGRASWPEGL